MEMQEYMIMFDVFGYNARIFDNVLVENNASYLGNATIHDVLIWGNANIYGMQLTQGCQSFLIMLMFMGMLPIDDKSCKSLGKRLRVYGELEICVDVNVLFAGDAIPREYAFVYTKAEIGEDAIIKDKFDYIVCRNNWSSGRFFYLYTRSNKCGKLDVSMVQAKNL